MPLVNVTDDLVPSNGMVALALMLEDAKLKSQVKAFLDYLLDHK